MKLSPVSGGRVALHMLFARADGTVLDFPDAEAAADDGRIARASRDEFIPLPEDSLLLTLPGRTPIGFENGDAVAIATHDGNPIDAVAAALPLGYTRTLVPAFQTRRGAPPLPLYGYAAVAWSAAGIVVAAAKTDALAAWSAAQHDPARLQAAIARRRAASPSNTLLVQLERCATEYGCYTAQNAFLRQGEAALPVSPACNARCIGCISEQDPAAGVKSAQERVRALPTVAEIVEVAAPHLEAVADGIVSFGQGCEGEPLLAAPLIEQAIRAIRARTPRGTIHCNTNASRPQMLRRLFAAGLQSLRISLNSARQETYAAYYRPRGYGFDDVCESLRLAGEAGARVSLNLLTHPGVTDCEAEMAAFAVLLRRYPIAMVQTRTLNVDPQLYFDAVGRPQSAPLGMRRWLAWMRAEFPTVALGNFTRGFG